MIKNSKISKKLSLPIENQNSKVLLHSCCAPCSGHLMEIMKENNINYTIFFYNPNIHPKKEYKIRKDENKRFADKLGIEFIDMDYDVREWFEKASPFSNEPERGKRCTMCFDIRFIETAKYASSNNFPVITSSLGISRWKDMQQINSSGHFAASQFKDVIYWDYNWRKQGGSSAMYEIAKNENFYKQEYCGCIYSLRDTNKWRLENQKEEIKIGREFYNNSKNTNI